MSFNNATELKDFILSLLEERKADDIVTMPLKGDPPLAQYMIFASGRSTKNISSMGEYISKELKAKSKIKPFIDGHKDSNWVLLDTGDVVVHLFHPEERTRLKLEELWKDR
jgi:ribosome-associated protein